MEGKITPDRSLTYKIDTQGVPYTEGNRKSRRIFFARKKIVNKKADKLRITKLPKELWKKGKSKFLEARLKQDGLKNISELY